MASDTELHKVLDVIKRKRAYIFSKYLPDPTHGCRPGDIKNVLVVISSSRSGSSLLYHLLSGHPATLAPQGEEITFYKLAGLGLLEKLGDSHAIANDISFSRSDREALAMDILRDTGRPYTSASNQDFPVEQYLVDSIQRLILQWPEIDFNSDELYRAAQNILGKHLHAGGAPFDPFLYWLDLLSALIAQGHPINPYYYDLPHDIIRSRHPAIPHNEGPPSSSICLEEPPFIVPKPKVFPDRVGKDDCLVLKSSSNCYRIEFMQSLFPNARYSFIYLTRNPAAVINGLMDGWLSKGFYSGSVEGLSVLNIAGYTSPQKPWTRYWWNFDSPPGWAGYVDQALEHVCAFQWWSTNKHVIDAIESGVISRYTVIKYEDLLNQESLKNQLGNAFYFAHLPEEAGLNGFKAPAPVMAVNPPGARKWIRRADVIIPAIMRENIASMALRLGYDINASEGFL
jgi:hypothetical protein